MTERYPDDGQSFPRWTVIGSVPTSLTPNSPILSKCPPMVTCDELLFPRRSILHNRFSCQRPHSLGSLTFSKCPPTDTCHGPSCTTVLVVKDPIPKGLSPFLSVLQRTHATDHQFHDGPSCTTVLVVRDPIPKDLTPFLSDL